MAISERTPWMPGKINMALWSDANKFMQKRLKSKEYRNHAVEKHRMFQLVETSAALANCAILNMICTVIKDDNHE